MQNVTGSKLDSKTLLLLQGVNSAVSSESRVVRAQQLQSLLQRSETNAAATAEHLPAGMPASTATAWIEASAAAAAAPKAGVKPSGPPLVVPVKLEPFDLMGPSVMPDRQPESSSSPIASQLRLRTDMTQVFASGAPDQMSRHALLEGIIFVRHSDLGLATDEELARAAVNGTLSNLVSMEPTRYPWLTEKYPGEQSFSLGSKCYLQYQAESQPSSLYRSQCRASCPFSRQAKP